MATLEEVCTQVATYLSTLSGIRAAPAKPPEKLDPLPMAVTYAREGVWEFGAAGVKRGLHVIVVDIHVARKDLPKDVDAAMNFSDSVPNLLMLKNQNDRTASGGWNGTISTFERITYFFGPMKWADLDTLGFRFRVEGVKVESAIT